MTKSTPKKVIKNTQPPSRYRQNYEVIRHFEPSERYTTCQTNIQNEIPIINVANEDENSIVKSNSTPTKKERTLKISNLNSLSNESTQQDNNLPTQNLTESKGSNNNQNFVSIRSFNRSCKSSSSSSVDTVLDKFANKPELKSRSFHSGQSKRQILKTVPISKFVNRPKVPKDIHISPRNASGTFKCLTDTSLDKELNIKSLKQEILANRRASALEPRVTNSVINSPRINNLKEEISKTQNRSILQKRLLITELKTEIAEFKRFNTFHIYTHSSSSTNRDGCCQDGQNGIPKSPKNISLCNETLGCRESKDLIGFCGSVLRKCSEKNISSGNDITDCSQKYSCADLIDLAETPKTGDIRADHVTEDSTKNQKCCRNSEDNILQKPLSLHDNVMAEVKERIKSGTDQDSFHTSDESFKFSPKHVWWVDRGHWFVSIVLMQHILASNFWNFEETIIYTASNCPQNMGGDRAWPLVSLIVLMQHILALYFWNFEET